MTPIETERLRIARLLDIYETKARALKQRLAEVLRLEETGDVEGVRLLVEGRKFWGVEDAAAAE